MQSSVIGVLALQGGFAKHKEMLKSLEAEVVEVRKPSDLTCCDGLILPGGESTTMLKQMEFIDFRESLVHFSREKPLFGTCAGLILMSHKIVDSEMQPLQIIHIDVERNAFGRQAESFETTLEVHLKSTQTQVVPSFFIRAPRIRHVGDKVSILASFEGEPVLVRQGFHLGATFHPELTTDSSIHAYFLDLVESSKKNKAVKENKEKL